MELARVCADECLEDFKKLRETCSDEDACNVIEKKFHETIFTSDYNSTTLYMKKIYTDTIRKKLSDAFPELKGAKILPSPPEALVKKANDDYMAKVIEYIKKPIEINADLMIQKATTGLQNALRDEIYPEVKLCLSFLL